MVAHVVSFDGGQERVTAELVTRLLERGRRVVVVTGRCELDPHPLLSVIRIPVPNRPASVTFSVFYLLAGLIVWAVREAGQPVHTANAIIPNRITVATVHFCHRHYYSEIGVSRARRQTRVFRMNEKLFARLSTLAEMWSYRPERCDWVAPVSDGVANEIRTCFPVSRGIVNTVSNGVDSEEFHPIDSAEKTKLRGKLGLPADRLIAVFVGGDWVRKGLRETIAALRDLPQWDLVVVGNGNVSEMTSLARQVGVDSQLVLTGRTPALPYLQAADAYVSASSYEAFSLAVLEAAATGLALVLTPVNGAEELIARGAARSIGRDAGAISEVLGDIEMASLREDLGRRARAAAEWYSWDRAVGAYEALYESAGRRP